MASQRTCRRYLKPIILARLMIACAVFALITSNPLFIPQAVMNISKRPAKGYDSPHHSLTAPADLQNLQRPAESPIWTAFIVMCNVALLVVSLVNLFCLVRQLIRLLRRSTQSAHPVFQADEVVDLKADEFRGCKSFGHGLWQGNTSRSVEVDGDEEDFWQRPG